MKDIPDINLPSLYLKKISIYVSVSNTQNAQCLSALMFPNSSYFHISVKSLKKEVKNELPK